MRISPDAPVADRITTAVMTAATLSTLRAGYSGCNAGCGGLSGGLGIHGSTSAVLISARNAAKGWRDGTSGKIAVARKSAISSMCRSECLSATAAERRWDNHSAPHPSKRQKGELSPQKVWRRKTRLKG